MLGRLSLSLRQQIVTYKLEGKVEILVEVDEGEETIGAKRNKLLQRAAGKYVAFIDDDDSISDDYLLKVFGGINQNRDCCSLNGIITFDGSNPKVFKHSIDYKKYDEVDGEYLRFPNHLNAIKASIAKQFKFPEKNYSEDTEWATALHESGLLKTEWRIFGTIYFYKYIRNK